MPGQMTVDDVLAEIETERQGTRMHPKGAQPMQARQVRRGDVLTVDSIECEVVGVTWLTYERGQPRTIQFELHVDHIPATSPLVVEADAELEVVRREAP